MADRVKDDQTETGTYSNRVISTTHDGAVAMITFGIALPVSERVNEPPNPTPVVTVNNRLLLPFSTLLDLHRQIGLLLTAIQPAAEKQKNVAKN